MIQHHLHGFDPDLSENTTLALSAKRSSMLVLIAKVIRYSFVFIVQILLMNLLMPTDYGILRFVTIVIGIINLLNELGLSSAIVQKSFLTDDELSSAFSLNAVLGTGLYIVTFFCAPFCASFFGNQAVTDLIRVGGLASLLGALSIVHRAILQRKLKFGHLALIEISSAFIGSCVALVLALSGFGVWALLGSMLIYNIVSSILLLLTVAWPKGSYFALMPAKALGLFGAGIVVQRIVEYGAQNFDFIIVGKVLGDKMLGVYSIAFTIISLPQVALGVVIGNVLLALASRIQDNDKLLSSIFLKLNLVTSVISVPFFVIIQLFSREMMHTVSFINHSTKWLPAATLLQILAPLGLLFSFSSYPGIIWCAKGKVKLRIIWAAATLISIVIAVYMGLPFGIKGICYALVIRGLLFFPVILKVTHHVIGLRPASYLKTLVPSVICGSIMLICIMPMAVFIPGTSFTRDMWVFFVGSTVGIVLYFGIFKMFFRMQYLSVLKIIGATGLKQR